MCNISQCHSSELPPFCQIQPVAAYSALGTSKGCVATKNITVPATHKRSKETQDVRHAMLDSVPNDDLEMKVQKKTNDARLHEDNGATTNSKLAAMDCYAQTNDYLLATTIRSIESTHSCLGIHFPSPPNISPCGNTQYRQKPGEQAPQAAATCPCTPHAMPSKGQPRGRRGQAAIYCATLQTTHHGTSKATHSTSACKVKPQNITVQRSGSAWQASTRQL